MEAVLKPPSPSCSVCRYVLLSDTSRSGLCCGWDYAQKPLLERMVRRMGSLPSSKGS